MVVSRKEPELQIWPVGTGSVKIAAGIKAILAGIRMGSRIKSARIDIKDSLCL
jgi:hypothetical protein